MVQTKGRKDESIYPYYAYGLPDTHVLSPSKTWTIFKTKEQMDREFMFLDMRGRFISMMYDVKFDSKGPFFVEAGDKDGKKGEKTVGKPLLKTPYFKKIDEAKVRSFFSDRANNEVIQSKDFEVIVKNIIANKKDYGVKYLDGKAKMTPEFEKDVMRVVDQAFKGFGVNADMVNGFFQRVSTLLLTPMDVHIINRIKLYFFYTNSYLSMDGVTNKEYAKQKVVYDELKSKKDKGEELDKDKTRKMNNANSRMHAERMRMICNKASMLFASILGDRGVILEKDDRNLLRSFGGPHVATMKNMKKKEREDLTIFDGQMRKYYAVS
ncbi:hypothetical protein PAEPH01_0041 [Pancytospora epiphaga]|nr:hypothetical protein PAEPH01_0041 [Pancytospora epiphaga]